MKPLYHLEIRNAYLDECFRLSLYADGPPQPWCVVVKQFRCAVRHAARDGLARRMIYRVVPA